MKRLYFKLKDCWWLLTSDQYALVSRKGGQVALSRQIRDQDVVSFFSAYINVITGNQSALDQAKQILDQ